MNRRKSPSIAGLLAILFVSGCASTHKAPPVAQAASKQIPEAADAALPTTNAAQIVLVSLEGDQKNGKDEDFAGAESDKPDKVPQTAPESVEVLPDAKPVTLDSLESLEQIALTQSPSLQRLAQEYQAACAKVQYVDGLPDPTIGANVFAAPIETAAGSQRANVMIAQMLPWLARLNAQAQQACLEAMALQQVHAAERLKIIGEVRSMWYRLYLIEKQIETYEANQQLLESLIELATARVSTGKATQGDVLVGTLEYSKLEEQLVTFRQQQVSTISEINRLLGRHAEISISGLQTLEVTLPEWTHPMLRDSASQNQPDIIAARIRTQATRWGVEIAQLKRRPDFSVTASWFAIDNNRPASGVVDVGQDAWSVGASVSIPLWERKYDAIEQEARWKHAASHASVHESIQRYDAVLRDLWEQAKAADETAKLYQRTILPQAKDTLSADQQSYANGTVDYDRVIGDFRNLLTLELGYHRAVSQLATALARIRQATGTELSGS